MTSYADFLFAVGCFSQAYAFEVNDVLARPDYLLPDVAVMRKHNETLSVEQRNAYYEYLCDEFKACKDK